MNFFRWYCVIQKQNSRKNIQTFTKKYSNSNIKTPLGGVVLCIFFTDLTLGCTGGQHKSGGILCSLDLGVWHSSSSSVLSTRFFCATKGSSISASGLEQSCVFIFSSVDSLLPGNILSNGATFCKI